VDGETPGLAIDAEAPPECGFPPGTPLEYAGRATTAELDVQEAIGDPMSDDPADIYITRDKFPQGEHLGRLVCAIFVNDPGFVEITVHPEDGGRFVPPTPAPSVTPPAGGISADEAEAIARGTVDEPAAWEAVTRIAGPLERVFRGRYEDLGWATGLPDDLWVWRIFLVRGDEGVDVMIEYVDGTVLGTIDYIVN